MTETTESCLSNDSSPMPTTPPAVVNSVSVPGSRRVLQLDMLRGVAILLVLGRHGIHDVGDLGPLRPLIATLSRFGWTGVDLFFVLSGFLIGGLIFAEIRSRDSLDVRRFYVRRGFKILPMYYVFLLIAAICLKIRVGGPWWYYGRTIARGWLIGVLNLQNYLSTPWIHTWSLAIEEHFYFFLPLVIWFFAFRGRRTASPVTSLPVIPVLALSAVVVCTTLRLWHAQGRPFDLGSDQFPTHLRIDGMLVGVLIAYLYHFRQGFREWVGRYRILLLAVGLTLVSPMLVLELETDRFVWTWGFAFLYTGYALVMLALVTTPLGQGHLGSALNSSPARVLAALGLYSYPVYLFHIDLVREPLLIHFESAFVKSMPPLVAWIWLNGLFVGFAWIIGVLFYKILEQRVISVRDRFFPARTASNAVETSEFDRSTAAGPTLSSATVRDGA